VGCPVERSSTGFEFGSAVEGQRSAMPSAATDECVRGYVGRTYDHPSESDRYQMIRTYFQMLIEEELPDAVGKMKQFASWFTHGVPGGAGLRKAIYESKSAPEILARVEDFFEARLSASGIASPREMQVFAREI
jgi:tRNA-dihydrouridine synthase